MTTYSLEPGQILNVVTDVGGGATVQRYDLSRATIYPLETVPVSTTAVFGPYSKRRYYQVTTQSQTATVTVTDHDELVVHTETNGPLAIQPTTVPVGVTQTIPATAQSVVFGTLTIRGTVSVAGVLAVPSIPTT